MFDFSLNVDLIVNNNNQKKQFKAFQIYPAKNVYYHEDKYIIELFDCVFSIPMADAEIYEKDEPETPKKKYKNKGVNVKDQDEEYFERTGKELNEVIYNALTNPVEDKIQKFLHEKQIHLKFTDSKQLFDEFARAGGMLIEENGEIKAVPFWQQRSRIPKKYYHKQHVNLVFDSNEFDAIGKFEKHKFKTVRIGGIKLRIWK